MSACGALRMVSTFTPKAVKGLETQVRDLAERLIGDIAPNGRCEFMHEVADLYPVEIFLQMFGLPLEREREYRELAKEQLTRAQEAEQDAQQRQSHVIRSSKFET